MSKSKHTHGPWFVVPDRLPNKNIRSRDINDIPLSGLIATVWNDRPADVESNAYLIAAAPDLLESCQVLLDAMLPDKTVEDRWEAMHVAYNAIDKAEGNQ